MHGNGNDGTDVLNKDINENDLTITYGQTKTLGDYGFVQGETKYLDETGCYVLVGFGLYVMNGDTQVPADDMFFWDFDVNFEFLCEDEDGVVTEYLENGNKLTLTAIWEEKTYELTVN